MRIKKKMKQKSLSRRSFEGVLNRNMRCQEFLTAMLIAVSMLLAFKQKINKNKIAVAML